MMILLTGGSACGKSSYAESMAVRMPTPRYYIATMQPYDQECLDKIERHRMLRKDKGFLTFECYRDLSELKLPKRGTVLLECICNLAANEMFDSQGNIHDPFEKVISGVDNLMEQSDSIIVVTNDVGSDSGPYDESTRRYIEVLGRINAVLAQKANNVYELVCGIPLVLKGALI